MQQFSPPHMQPPPYAPGKMFLLVTGIIMIVFGGFGIIGGIGLAFLGDVIDALDPLGTGVGGAVQFWAFITIIAAGLMLAMGILGIVWRTALEKAQILIILGASSLLLDIISGIALRTIGVLSVIGWVLPILFIIGAVKNKQAMTA